ncbi:uncharacterized protein [Acropora muricata]|uniref:uncharacterized protein isoform X2 n=1 Tax=Acropora muricata TaxID=159855 RepID=UPI0034E53FBE
MDANGSKILRKIVCTFFWSKGDHYCSENKLLLNYHFIFGLWKVLSDNSLSHKVLISVSYSFIDSGDKEEGAFCVECVVSPFLPPYFPPFISVMSACLLVVVGAHGCSVLPKLSRGMCFGDFFLFFALGNGAHNIFHPLLFQKALDVLQLWTCKGEKKRKL